ncbi:hypothetical protein AAL_01926 [Moelleriella libera RCEF 2490]|uniref:Uncharacterized protein n=1 Tax=Moelleriella libera RCEF 2490 TaxID=1081109 RepID=A0A168F0X6_9HYPO|nr:hypothetical protein AAL_01926 [Moelleriella libera RCEF 2490]
MDVPELNTVGPAVCNSMGNLADELAHAFSDSGEEEQDQCEEEEYSHKSTASTDAANTEETKPPFGESNDTESLVLYPSTGRYDSRQDVSGRSSMLTTGIRKAAVDYEGSEYGSGSDLECAGMPVTLISKIERIESLCWRGTNDYGDPDDAIFDRVAGCLRDLGSQSTVEGNASR